MSATHKLAVAVVALVSATVASAALAGSSASSARSYVGYPSSIAVLGHSAATGESSDPKRPGVEVRENSWATGTNPAVNSVYLRILAKNPAIRGHNINLAKGGATVGQLVGQARQAVALEPKPDLFLIQIMDNDIVCPAKARDYSGFLSTFVSALAVLARSAPESSIFVVSQFGSPGTYTKSLTRTERRAIGATGPCDPVDPAGRIVPKKVARLDSVIHLYEAQLKAGCGRVSHLPLRRRCVREDRRQARVHLRLRLEPFLAERPCQGRGSCLGGDDASRAPTSAR